LGDISEKWIKKHLLFGIERTYTTPSLDTFAFDEEDESTNRNLLDDFEISPKLKGFSSDPSDFKFSEISYILDKAFYYSKKSKTEKKLFSSEQIEDLIRFIKKVLKPKSLNLQIRDLILYNSSFSSFFDFPKHIQPIFFWGVDYRGRKFSLTLEPGCLEINFEPVVYSKIEDTWSEIDKNALKYGFKASLYYGGSSNGGTHFHLGWKGSKNLWKIDSKLSHALRAFVLNNPGLLYLLGEAGGFGFSDSDLLYYPSYKHSSFISTKNQFSRNPSIEIRFHRCFRNVKELKLVANFWIRMLSFLIKNKNHIDKLNEELALADFKIIEERLFDLLKKQLKFKNKEISKLNNLGGDPMFPFMAPLVIQKNKQFNISAYQIFEWVDPFESSFILTLLIKSQFPVSKSYNFSVSSNKPKHYPSSESKRLTFRENTASIRLHKRFRKGTNYFLNINSNSDKTRYRFKIYQSPQNSYSLIIQELVIAN
jgi:hypothetical protein